VPLLEDPRMAVLLSPAELRLVMRFRRSKPCKDPPVHLAA